MALQPEIAENAAIDTAQKDPVLSGFLNQLGGSVAKRQVQEYYGEGIPVLLDLPFPPLQPLPHVNNRSSLYMWQGVRQ